MGVTSGFFNSRNHDRLYNAEQVGSIFDGLISDGVYAHYGNHFSVTPVSNQMKVNVGTGRAWFNHTWTLNDAIMVVNIDPSDLQYSRIDAIVIEVNKNNRNNSISYISGSPAASPQPPTLTRDNGVFQYPIAYITVPRNATKITSANINPRVGTSDCPYVAAMLDDSVSVEEFVNQYAEGFQNALAQLSSEMATWKSNTIGLIEELSGEDPEALSTYAAVARVENTFDNRVNRIEAMWRDVMALDDVSPRISTLEGYFNSSVPYFTSAPASIDSPEYVFCKFKSGTGGALGTFPSISSNQCFVITMTTDMSQQYNAQFAFGFGNKIAIRRKHGDASTWQPWKVYAFT